MSFIKALRKNVEKSMEEYILEKYGIKPTEYTITWEHKIDMIDDWDKVLDKNGEVNILLKKILEKE